MGEDYSRVWILAGRDHRGPSWRLATKQKENKFRECVLESFIGISDVGGLQTVAEYVLK